MKYRTLLLSAVLLPVAHAQRWDYNLSQYIGKSYGQMPYTANSTGGGTVSELNDYSAGVLAIYTDTMFGPQTDKPLTQSQGVIIGTPLTPATALTQAGSSLMAVFTLGLRTANYGSTFTNALSMGFVNTSSANQDFYGSLFSGANGTISTQQVASIYRAHYPMHYNSVSSNPTWSDVPVNLSTQGLRQTFNITLTNVGDGTFRYDFDYFGALPTRQYHNSTLISAQTLSAGYNGFLINSLGNSGNITVDSVAMVYSIPEPASYGLAGAGALGFAAFVRRRKRPQPESSASAA